MRAAREPCSAYGTAVKGKRSAPASHISLVDPDAAASLIERAVPRCPSTWADLGAGTGTFTLALATLLGSGSEVVAVERDGAALDALRAAERRRTDGAKITMLAADFTQPLAVPDLDGVLLGNALHFVSGPEQSVLLKRLSQHVRPGGRFVVVEYEGRRPSRWVPYPVSFARLQQLAREAGLDDPVRVGSRRSLFGGDIYAAMATTRR